MGWTEQEAEQVQGLLTTFSGADEVCAVVDCDKADLDALCQDAFDMDFKCAQEHFAAQGRAMVRKALFEQALEGNAKAMDMLAREQLGLGPVETRKRVAKEKEDDEHEQDASILKLIQGNRKNRRAKAAGQH